MTSFRPTLVRTVAPSGPPLQVQQVAEYLRMDAAEEAGEVERLIYQAAEEVERYTGRALLNATYRASFSGWPTDPSDGCFTRQIELGRAPLLSVTSVKYYDEDGTDTTADVGNYAVLTDYEPGVLSLVSDYEFPTLYERPDAIRVTFTAGYGTAPEAVPEMLKQAMLLLCRYYYAGGSPNTEKERDREAAESLMDGWKVHGWWA